MEKIPTQWKVIAASTAGSSHAAAGNACQDSFAYRVTADGILIAAVADGAGSSRYAGEGAELAARSAVEHLTSALESSKPGNSGECRSLLQSCLLHARRCLEEQALVRGSRANHTGDPGFESFPGLDRASRLPAPPPGSGEISLLDFSTTLLAVFVTDRHLAALQVGDGAIVYQQASGTLTVACEPDHGEYLNETQFITSIDLERHAHYRIAGGTDVSSLAMLSDGLETLAVVYRDNTAYGGFFNPLFDFVRRDDACEEELRQFFLSGRVCERSDDDKTLVLAIRTGA